MPRDEVYQTWVRGVEFGNEWFCIARTGLATVKQGYAVDGNSPKILILNLGYIGPPDGKIIPGTNLPSTYRAFFIRDALIQFAADLNIQPNKAHREYCKEIKLTRFPLRNLYCCAVYLFGPR